MTSLLLATLLFLGIHIFISGTPLRGLLVARIGEKAYAGVFSLLSLGAIVWMSMAYVSAPHEELWTAGALARYLTPLLVLLGMVLAMIGLTTPNPTSAGAEGVLKQEHAAKGIVSITRHPFLWGVALWAVGHLLANGDLASLIFFGGFLALSLIGPHLIDRKRANKDPEDRARFAAETSWVPFAAIAQGRAKLNLIEIGWLRPLGGIALYAVFVLYLHGLLFGVPAYAV